MTFTAFFENERTTVLIDTGSFVTLIDSRLVADLSEVRPVETPLKYIEGISGLKKNVEGAVITEIKVREHKLPLKCHVVHNMPYLPMP